MLDIFSAVRGWASGVKAFEAGDEQGAKQIWGDLENQMKLIASALGIRYSAELHPLQVQAQRENIATTKQVREFNAQEQPFRMRGLEQKAEMGDIELGDIKAIREALASQGINATDEQVQKVKQNIAESKVSEAMSSQELGFAPQIVETKVRQATADLLKTRADILKLRRDAEAQGKTNESLEYRKQQDMIENLIYQSIGYPGGKAEFDAKKSVSGEKRAIAGEQRESTEFTERDLPAARSRQLSILDDVNRAIQAIQSGDSMNYVVALKFLGADASEADKAPLRAGKNDKSTKLIALRAYARAANDLARIYSNDPEITSIATRINEAVTQYGGSPTTTTSTTAPTGEPAFKSDYVEELKRNRVR